MPGWGNPRGIMSTRKPAITVDATLHERTRGPVTGLGLTIDYAGGMARISMPDFPALREGGEFERATRNKLMGLADAIREAAQSPDGIFWHHRERI